VPRKPAIAATSLTGASNLAPATTGIARPHRQDTTWEPDERPLDRRGKAALLFAILSGLTTLGYHLFDYPLYATDEGIYMERAWSVIREGQLNPYTYIYDHAPGGWLFIAAWDFILPHQFLAFGNPVDTGRAPWPSVPHQLTSRLDCDPLRLSSSSAAMASRRRREVSAVSAASMTSLSTSASSLVLYVCARLRRPRRSGSRDAFAASEYFAMLPIVSSSSGCAK
jgi:hypothetical protein